MDFDRNIILYDWVTVSCKNPDPHFFMELLGIDESCWEQMNKGLDGYKQGYFFESIRLLYDGNDNMGTCLILSGQGCRVFEDASALGYDHFFQLIIDNPDFFHLTRLDVAYDDHTGILPILQIADDALQFDFVSKFRSRKVVREGESVKEDATSIYHGTRKSAMMFRIYDKAKERGYTDGRHWIRLEMQLKEERALAFIKGTEPIGQMFFGVVHNYLRYVEPSADPNRWRWPMTSYWSNLLGNVKKIKLYEAPGVDYNVSQLDEFVFRQAGNAIDAAIKIHGVPGFFDMLRNRGSISNPKYEHLIDQFRTNRYNDFEPKKGGFSDVSVIEQNKNNV